MPEEEPAAKLKLVSGTAGDHMLAKTMKDPRDVLWNEAFNTRYYTLYQELCLHALIRKWTLLDRVTKVLVGVTSSGSVVAGLTLWDEPGWKTLWAILAGSAALLSIVHSNLSIPDTLKQYGELLSKLVMLRLDLEDYARRCNMNPEFDVRRFEEDFNQLRSRFKEISSVPLSDPLFTNSIRDSAQNQSAALVSPSNEYLTAESTAAAPAAIEAGASDPSHITRN